MTRFSTIGDRYTILRLLGVGASGKVFLAKDNRNPDKPVAVKIFSSGFPADRIRREFETLQKLYHPNIVEIRDTGTDKSGRNFLVSEFVDGKNILDHGRSLSLADKCRLLAELALALDFVRQKNIIHLDLKPSNLLIECTHRKPNLKILDFGLAQGQTGSASAKPRGTLSYMAPELLEGKKVDARADLYSFGMIAYELFTGNLPASGAENMIRFHLREGGRNLKIHPPFLEKIIRTCLAGKPADRFTRGLDIAKELSAGAELGLDLSPYGFLEGQNRTELDVTLKNVFAELEGALKKKRGNLSAEEWGEALRRLGRYEEALNHLRTFSAKNEALWHQANTLKARILIEQGKYDDVLAIPVKTADQRNARGLACFYLGKWKEAERDLKQAFSEGTTPLQKASSANYLGMTFYNQGKGKEAERYYKKAQALLKDEADKQPLVSVLMNQGTLFQQEEKYALAVTYYQQSLKLARRIHHGYLFATLLNNLANLYVRFGAAREARSFLGQSQKMADELNIPYLSAYNLLIEGDLSVLERKFENADRCFNEAMKRFQILNLKREQDIARINLFENALLTSNPAAAAKLARNDKEHDKVSILEGKQIPPPKKPSPLDCLVWARGFLKQSKTGDAARIVESGHQAYLHLRECLPHEYKDTLACHPLWEQILALKDKLAEDDPVKLANFRKLLEVNKKMATEHEGRHLLEFIMDAVIEITGAERGFLLLASSRKKNEPFRVDVARNIDQESIRKAAFKLSRTVVQRVLHDKKPVLTTDASSDPHLKTAQSVQALKLKSLLCVPLLHRGKLLGAIYVENRFQKGVFTSDSLEVLTAFADQAAIALENTRLMEENSRKAEEISKLNTNLETMVARQSVRLEQISRELSQKQKSLERKYNYSSIVGDSPAMEKVFDLLDRLTDRESSVLITGESGTGKELAARALHYNGPRKEKEFVAVNCSAIPANLLESELFGHVRGAFTGAERDKAGLFETADGGTLFLDEIGDMPLEMQAKLLRVLQEREVRRIGSNRKFTVDVRVVSATNKDLGAACRKKTFREDLFYRLNAVEIRLPPLRERKEDIPLLVRHFLAKLDPAAPRSLSPDALDTLIHYDWPGNVRELINELERGLSLSEKEIGVRVLSDKILHGLGVETSAGKRFGIRAHRQNFEKSMVQKALVEANGNKSMAAKNLGISRVALYQKIKSLQIESKIA